MSSTGASDFAASVLPTPASPSEQQRLGQAQAQEHRRREALVDEVVDVGEPPRKRLDVGHEPAKLVGRLARAGEGTVMRARCCASNFDLQPSQQK